MLDTVPEMRRWHDGAQMDGHVEGELGISLHVGTLYRELGKNVETIAGEPPDSQISNLNAHAISGSPQATRLLNPHTSPRPPLVLQCHGILFDAENQLPLL
ncbi:uncharacterized protein TrAFT101_003165 [Trichoderma asperellum]|uniref:uncharacterized protein n=1 Tax=Trichoderma asperellum TaxID=101201 RepID=UPI003325817F|nr:hypothetical protein TrAFT101_003165 [Trichoderma asperellum]